jgi:hypothetical protein
MRGAGAAGHVVSSTGARATTAYDTRRDETT